jgi:probable F420-dependent oxidoreductase
MEFPFSDAKAFWKWIAMSEEGGVDSYWQTDRLISRRPILECMSAMAAVAGATERMKFGMNVASVGLRDPLLLAKQCATIDFLSDGRLLPAFGIGSTLGPDWKAMGRPTKGRGRMVDEALDAIAALWRGEALTANGEFFTFEGATISPTPVQKHFPLWIGGSSKAAIQRTARIGTGWLAGRETPEEAGLAVAAIKEACKAIGRSIDEDHYGAGFYFRFGSWDEPFMEKRLEAMAKMFPDRDPKNAVAVGDGSEIVKRIQRYVDNGVSKFILRPMGADDAEVMDQTRLLIRDVFPAVAAMNEAEAA